VGDGAPFDNWPGITAWAADDGEKGWARAFDHPSGEFFARCPQMPSMRVCTMTPASMPCLAQTAMVAWK